LSRHSSASAAAKLILCGEHAVVWAAERPLPWAYRRAAFHAISESTRDDLVARGVESSRVRVIHPGVDAVHYVPDPAGRRTAVPSFLYVGRLKRYKGIGLAIRALAHARARRPRQLSLDLTLDQRVRRLRRDNNPE